MIYSFTPKINDDDNKLTFKTIIKATPLIYGFLIFCGAIYLEIYYNYFDINIFRYLEISELLTTSIYILIPIIMQYACDIIKFVIIPVFFLDCILCFVDKKRPSLYNIKCVSLYKKHIDKFLIIWNLGLIIILLFCLHKNYEGNFDSNKIYIYENVSKWIIILSIIVLLVEFKSGKIKYFIQTIIIVLIFAIVSQAYYDADARIKNLKNEIVMIRTEKDTIITDSNYLYVGRTNNDVFLYNKRDKFRELIPTSIIKEIKFK
jgi:hypothetical protein